MLPITVSMLIGTTSVAAFFGPSLPAAPLDSGVDSLPKHQVVEIAGGIILAGDHVFLSWPEYFQSEFFETHKGKCGSPVRNEREVISRGNSADCTNGYTNPAGEYAPSGGTFRIPVVVHVITRNNGEGDISDSMIQSQIDVLNEDYRALPGSLGAAGTDCNIELYLAAVDPDGSPTTGITRSASNRWYNDRGNYKNALSWDTNRYLNIYTNTADGYLGYAYIPNGGGVVGSSTDGVVINWQAFGRNSPLSPYDLGRTATHEVGHYLGLYHTFQGGCASTSACYANGDLICDTNPEGSPNYSGCSRASCGSSDPVKNYMDYSEDLCMNNFTDEQARRMRCTIENWRSELCSWDNGGGDPAGACCIVADCTEVTEAACISSGGTYQGDSSSCGNVFCDGGDPAGACCIGTSCSDETESDCLAFGGSYQGDGISCGSVSCSGGGDPADAVILSATIGIGDNVGGSAASLSNSDNDYLDIDASRSGSKYECRVDVAFLSASTTASRIDIRTEVGASATGAKTRIYLQDVNSGSWDRIISYNQGTGDTVREAIDVGPPSSYIEPSTGVIMVRVYNIKRNGDYIVNIDEVNVTVTP